MSDAVFASLLITDFTVARRRRTPDGQGGWVIDYIPVGTVRGRIRPATSQEREVAASEERQVSHVLYVFAGEDIARGDRVMAGQLVVDVTAIKEPSLAGEHWEIECLERQQEESMVETGS